MTENHPVQVKQAERCIGRIKQSHSLVSLKAVTMNDVLQWGGPTRVQQRYEMKHSTIVLLGRRKWSLFYVSCEAPGVSNLAEI